MTRNELRVSLVSCALCTFVGLFAISNDSLHAEIIHAPDFSQNMGGYRVAGKRITLAAENAPESNLGKSLKITATGGNGQVKSSAFSVRPSAKTTRAVKGYDLAFWSVKYNLRNDLRRGTCRVRLRILDPDDPYDMGFEHFGGTETREDGFACIHKPLCAIVSTHPHKRKAAGNNQAELVVTLEDAEGQVWLNNVEITTAEPGGPGFTDQEWDSFETGDGIHYTGVTANMYQPEYTPAVPHGYASPLVMDTAHKLFRAAGFNMVRVFTYWNDHNAHYPATQHQVIIWNSDPDGGTGDYEESLTALKKGIDNLTYYGLGTQLCLRGSPDWAHPLHHNNAPANERQGTDLFSNPGNPNGVGDPYYGPPYQQSRNWCYPPDDWQTWRDFATQLATSLRGKGLIYEIMNEINVPDQDSLIGGYKAYSLWFKHFSEAAKTADPDARVIVADAGKMLPPLISEGVLDYADGVAFHLYAGELASVRAMVQTSGHKMHLYMSEYMKMRLDNRPQMNLKNTTRQQVLWNAFSTLDYRHFANILTLNDANGDPVYNNKPPGVGDRIKLTENYDVWGLYNEVFQQDDRVGKSGDRIKAEVICPRDVRFDSSQTVTLRATNISATTYHDVRLWPVGFVETLGFDLEDIRMADVRIATFPPGQQHEIKLTVKPRTTRVRADEIYDIGLAVVSREGKHSLAMVEICIANARTADNGVPVSQE